MVVPNSAKLALSIAKSIHDEELVKKPPEVGLRAHHDQVVPFSVVRDTRGYIEIVTNQVNGCYESGWYDACAVMIRRLIETLIIEAFEQNEIADKIKTASGDFLYLGDLINKTLNEPSWNLGRNAKRGLKRLKDIGDKSAHSRRFNAHRDDIRRVIPTVRTVVQELIYIADLQ